MTLRMASRTARTLTLAIAMFTLGSAAPTALHAQAQIVTRLSADKASSMVMLSPSTVYPASAGKAKGDVVVTIRVDIAGKPTVLKTSGPEVFRKTAADSVSHYHYHPYELNGKATPFESTVTLHFAPPA